MVPELAERLQGDVVRRAPLLYASGYSESASLPGTVLDSGIHFIGKPFEAGTLTKKVNATSSTPSGRTVTCCGAATTPARPIASLTHEERRHRAERWL